MSRNGRTGAGCVFKYYQFFPIDDVSRDAQRRKNERTWHAWREPVKRSLLGHDMSAELGLIGLETL